MASNGPGIHLKPLNPLTGNRGSSGNQQNLSLTSQAGPIKINGTAHFATPSGKIKISEHTRYAGFDGSVELATSPKKHFKASTGLQVATLKDNIYSNPGLNPVDKANGEPGGKTYAGVTGKVEYTGKWLGVGIEGGGVVDVTHKENPPFNWKNPAQTYVAVKTGVSVIPKNKVVDLTLTGSGTYYFNAKDEANKLQLAGGAQATFLPKRRVKPYVYAEATTHNGKQMGAGISFDLNKPKA